MTTTPCQRCGLALPAPTGRRGRPRRYCLHCAPFRRLHAHEQTESVAAIERRLAAAERAVRGTIPLDPWAMRGSRIEHQDRDDWSDVRAAATRVNGAQGHWGGYYSLGRQRTPKPKG